MFVVSIIFFATVERPNKCENVGLVVLLELTSANQLQMQDVEEERYQEIRHW